MTSIIPMNANEVFYTNKIAKLLLYNTEAIPNNKGEFLSIKIKSNSKFNRNDIGFILSKFKSRFNKKLVFEKINSNNFSYIGYLTIKNNYECTTNH